MDIKSRLEAVVFSEGGEMSINAILKVLGITHDSLNQIIQSYNEDSRGLVFVIDAKKVLMRVSSACATLVEEMRIDMQQDDISKAGLEVLSIVLYSHDGGISASEVEYIRGVNSGYTLRQLTMRGLLSKTRKGVGYRYTPTADLLSFLGVNNISSLPDIGQIQAELDKYKDRENDKDN